MPLLFLLLAACGVRTVPRPAPEGVVLGWRLAPGMELCYRLESRHEVGRDTVVRQEDWSYLVRRVEGAEVFLLEARLLDLEATILRGGQALPHSAMATAREEERDRLQARPVALALSLDGSLDWREPADWADALPHRLLALALPSGAVGPGDRWADAAAARPYAELLPAQVPVRVNGATRLEAFTWDVRRTPRPREDRLLAELATEAVVQSEDARFPTVEVTGQAAWDLDAGRLARRTLQVGERGGEGAGEAGTLHISLSEQACPGAGGAHPPRRSR